MSTTSDYDPAKRQGAATTFRVDEVDALVQLFRELRGGRDVAVLLRAKSLQSVERKFTSMQQKLRERGK